MSLRLDSPVFSILSPHYPLWVPCITSKHIYNQLLNWEGYQATSVYNIYRSLYNPSLELPDFNNTGSNTPTAPEPPTNGEIFYNSAMNSGFPPNFTLENMLDMLNFENSPFQPDQPMDSNNPFHQIVLPEFREEHWNRNQNTISYPPPGFSGTNSWPSLARSNQDQSGNPGPDQQIAIPIQASAENRRRSQGIPRNQWRSSTSNRIRPNNIVLTGPESGNARFDWRFRRNRRDTQNRNMLALPAPESPRPSEVALNRPKPFRSTYVAPPRFARNSTINPRGRFGSRDRSRQAGRANNMSNYQGRNRGFHRYRSARGCSFCFKGNMGADAYRHQLITNNVITCPVLLKVLCNYCKGTGHTVKYCPDNPHRQIPCLERLADQD